MKFQKKGFWGEIFLTLVTFILEPAFFPEFDGTSHKLVINTRVGTILRKSVQNRRFSEQFQENDCGGKILTAVMFVLKTGVF